VRQDQTISDWIDRVVQEPSNGYFIRRSIQEFSIVAHAQDLLQPIAAIIFPTPVCPFSGSDKAVPGKIGCRHLTQHPGSNQQTRACAFESSSPIRLRRMPLVMEFLLKERITQIHTFQNACDGGYSRVCLARVRVRQRLKRITKLVGGCLLNCRQNIRPIVPNIDYVCCAYATCLTDSNIDCRNLKGRCFYEPAGRIAHNSNGATQHTVVRLRAKIIDHFPPYWDSIEPTAACGLR